MFDDFSIFDVMGLVALTLLGLNPPVGILTALFVAVRKS